MSPTKVTYQVKNRWRWAKDSFWRDQQRNLALERTLYPLRGPLDILRKYKK